jgi:tetratricopeptide (TPR) repeat protein
MIDTEKGKLPNEKPGEMFGSWMSANKLLVDGDYEGAILAFKKAINKWPKEDWPYQGLGSAYNKQGRYKEAVDAFKQAIYFNPNDTISLEGLAFAYLNLGRHEESVFILRQAVSAYKQLIRRAPDNASLHYSLGVVYLLLKDRAAALEEYKILQTLDKEKANDLFNCIYK